MYLATFFGCPISGFLDPAHNVGQDSDAQHAQPAEDPRAMIALARVNWLHSQYNIVCLLSLTVVPSPIENFVP